MPNFKVKVMGQKILYHVKDLITRSAQSHVQYESHTSYDLFRHGKGKSSSKVCQILRSRSQCKILWHLMKVFLNGIQLCNTDVQYEKPIFSGISFGQG